MVPFWDGDYRSQSSSDKVIGSLGHVIPCIPIETSWQSKEIFDAIRVFPKIVGFPPKSSILIGFSIIFTIHCGGFPPIFGNTHKNWHANQLPISHVDHRSDVMDPCRDANTQGPRCRMCFTSVSSKLRGELHHETVNGQRLASWGYSITLIQGSPTPRLSIGLVYLSTCNENHTNYITKCRWNTPYIELFGTKL